MTDKSKKKRVRWSKISLLHAWKLGARSLLLILAVLAYIFGAVLGHTDAVLGALEDSWILLIVVWIFFAIEMLLRFFPSNIESMGCQKQFKKNFIPTEQTKPNIPKKRGTFITLTSWLLLNGVIAALYFLNVIDAGILILISLVYSVCDMICILFFCPFQTWFMKNKCCGSCRIYNWDYVMMCTPLVLIPNLFTIGLFSLALSLLIVWEIAVARHPERFSEATNAALRCANCKEKLCHHKRQLRAFLKKNSEKIRLRDRLVLARERARRLLHREKNAPPQDGE